MIRAVALTVVTVAAGLANGCVLLNEGDIGGARVADAGPPDADGGLDADAGRDGGDACPPSGCLDLETSCTNGEDDDGDGIVDCADFDCSDFPGCCDDGSTLFEEDWDPATTFSLAWKSVPSGAPYPARTRETPDGGTGRTFLSAFDDGMPSGVVRRACSPLALGARLRLSMAPLGATGCTDTSCDRFAALVLTAAQDTLPGRRLLDDLAVTVQANGLVRVTQAGRSLGETHAEVAPEGLVEIGVDVTPGVDGRGRPALFATVGVTDRAAGAGEQVLLEREPFLLQRDLLSEGGCAQVPGLFVAVEGQGDRVQVEPLTAGTRQCVNPSQFGAPETETATLTPDRLGLGDWSEGGLGDPALASTCDLGEVGCWNGDTGPGVRWDLLVEGTNVDPALGRFTHVGWALGHSVSTAWDAAAGWVADGLGEPKAGADPPTCLDPASDGGIDPCDGARSVRDPALWPFTDELGQVSPTDGFAVAYAREWEPAVMDGERDVFALHVQTMSPDPEVSFPAAEARIWTPEDAGCDSLRDPELIPATRTPGEDGYWLLYTCVRSGEPPEVHRMRLSGLFQPQAGSTPEPVLSPPELGGYAAGGVRAAEALVASDLQNTAQPPLVRVWFEARDAAGRASIGLAQGRSETFDAFPVLTEYRGSPVLRPDDAALGGGCGEGCELVGFDVVRRADDPRASDAPQTLRFVVARRTDGGGYELVPVEQLWRPPQ